MSHSEPALQYASQVLRCNVADIPPDVTQAIEDVIHGIGGVKTFPTLSVEAVAMICRDHIRARRAELEAAQAAQIGADKKASTEKKTKRRKAAAAFSKAPRAESIPAD